MFYFFLNREKKKHEINHLNFVLTSLIFCSFQIIQMLMKVAKVQPMFLKSSSSLETIFESCQWSRSIHYWSFFLALIYIS